MNKNIIYVKKLLAKAYIITIKIIFTNCNCFKLTFVKININKNHNIHIFYN